MHKLCLTDCLEEKGQKLQTTKNITNQVGTDRRHCALSQKIMHSFILLDLQLGKNYMLVGSLVGQFSCSTEVA